jgi:hypothetical protein
LPAVCAAQAPEALAAQRWGTNTKTSHINVLNGTRSASKHLHNYFGVDSQAAILALHAVNISRKRNTG